MVDILVVAIHQNLFRLDYAAPASTAKCDYRLRDAYDRYIMLDVEHRSERVEIER